MADHVISMDFNRLPAKQRFGTEQHSRVKTAVYEFPGIHAVEQAELSDGVGFFRAIRLTLLIEFGLGLAVFEVWRLLQ